jgi:Ca2+-binding EF-hand superfamily protein
VEKHEKEAFMRTPKPLITAVILSLAVAGPAALAAGSSGVNDQAKKKPAQNSQNRGNQGNQNRGNQGNGHGNGGGTGSGEDLTHMRFAGLDTNHDGRITRDEWRGNDNSFNQHDWNGDGVLSGIEVTPGVQRPGGDDDDEGENDEIADRFESLDLNHDNRISLSEWRGQRDVFERLDLNDDGFLVLDELRLGNNSRLARTFRGLDVNHDLQLSRSEWRGDAALFDRLDANHNGFLSWTEFSRRS